MNITRWLKTDKLVLVTLLLVILIMYIHSGIIDFLLKNFESALQALLGLSISLILFPFITVPIVHNVVTRARELGIKINKNLIKDYINACFIVFILATMEIVSIIIYSLASSPLWFYIIFPVLVTMLIMLVLLTLGLWQVVKILYEIIKE